VWVEPQWDPDLHLAHPPAPESFEAAFDAHPDARGALVTSPTPYGTTADLAAIVEICHRRDRPVIVDEAWGAHLPFHPDLPTWAMDAGADVCVTSAHKMGSGFEQGSVFHLQGDRISPESPAARADLLGTTSPSVLLYAGLDGWRRQMVEQGEELLGRALALVERARSAVAEIDGLHVHGRADFCGAGRAHGMDPLQVFADVSGLGVPQEVDPADGRAAAGR
jgi:arginine decarboxylase